MRHWGIRRGPLYRYGGELYPTGTTAGGPSFSVLKRGTGWGLSGAALDHRSVFTLPIKVVHRAGCTHKTARHARPSGPPAAALRPGLVAWATTANGETSELPPPPFVAFPIRCCVPPAKRIPSRQTQPRAPLPHDCGLRTMDCGRRTAAQPEIHA